MSSEKTTIPQQPVHQAHALLKRDASPQDLAPGRSSDKMPRRREGRTPGGLGIAITGGKGGVGKTVLAVNLAILAQRAGFRVLLVDFDPGLGNVDVHLRLAPTHTLEDLALGRCTPPEAIQRDAVPASGTGRLDIILGKSGSTRMFRPRILEQAHAQIDTLRADYDLVLFDTGAGIGPHVLETLRRVDLSLAVTTPEPAAITDAYALCKVAHNEGIAIPSLVLNRVADKESGSRTAGKLANICEQFLGKRPDFTGLVRDDAVLGRTVVDQVPLATGRHKTSEPCTALDDLRALAGSVLSRIPKRQTQTRSKDELRSTQRDARRLLAAAPKRQTATP